MRTLLCRSRRSLNLPLATRQTVVGYALPELHSPDGKLHQIDEEYPPRVHQDLLETVLEVMSSAKGIDHLEGELLQGTDPPGPWPTELVRGPGIVVLRGDQQILLWLVNLSP